MKKIIESFPTKKNTAKITIRIDEDLKNKLLKVINRLKKENPDIRISTNQLIKQYIIDFIGD